MLPSQGGLKTRSSNTCNNFWPIFTWQVVNLFLTTPEQIFHVPVSTFLDEITIISMKAVLMTQRQKKFFVQKELHKSIWSLWRGGKCLQKLLLEAAPEWLINIRVTSWRNKVISFCIEYYVPWEPKIHIPSHTWNLVEMIW